MKTMKILKFPEKIFQVPASLLLLLDVHLIVFLLFISNEMNISAAAHPLVFGVMNCPQSNNY